MPTHRLSQCTPVVRMTCTFAFPPFEEDSRPKNVEHGEYYPHHCVAVYLHDGEQVVRNAERGERNQHLRVESKKGEIERYRAAKVMEYLI